MQVFSGLLALGSIAAVLVGICLIFAPAALIVGGLVGVYLATELAQSKATGK